MENYVLELLGKKKYINYKTGRMVGLLEATGLQIFSGKEYIESYNKNDITLSLIEYDKMYIGNILNQQAKVIICLEEVEQQIKNNIKNTFGEYIEIEDRSFYKENAGVEGLFKNALFEMRQV